MNQNEKNMPDTGTENSMCTKPFDQENSRFDDEDNPCRNGEG